MNSLTFLGQYLCAKTLLNCFSDSAAVVMSSEFLLRIDNFEGLLGRKPVTILYPQRLQILVGRGFRQEGQSLLLFIE